MAVHTWTVDEVCESVFAALESIFPDEFWVRGEIQGLRKAPAGHLYFDLVEPGAKGRGQDAKLGVVAFRGPLRGIEAVLRKVGNLELTDGMEVRIRGKVDFYPPQGRVQFIMSAIDPRHTLGQLSADRDQLMRAFHAEDLINRNGRLPVPRVPLRVGLVTSDDSAAYNDFVEELAQSPFAFQVLFADARVQGVDAEPTLVRAIEALQAHAVDVIAIVRGGGAKGDLLAFDRESVARAVATSSVPVFVGVGHEIDRAVVDEVAHSSLKTPTACAAALVDRVTEFVDRMNTIAAATRHHAGRLIATRSQRLDADASRLHRATNSAMNMNSRTLMTHKVALSTRAATMLNAAKLSVDRNAGRAVAATGLRVGQSDVALNAIAARLPVVSKRAFDIATTKLSAADTLVRAVHPHRTLARGYSITRAADGAVVRSAHQVVTPEQLRTEVVDGIITSTVLESASKSEDPNEPATAAGTPDPGAPEPTPPLTRAAEERD